MTTKYLLKQMTLDEKIKFLCGSNKDSMCTEACERLNVPHQYLTDGPMGVRIEEGYKENCTCFPCETAMAATWNKSLVEEVGSGIANDCLKMGKDMILGPGVNIKRTPLCGRNFEYFSEDPVLSGKMAASYVRGVQRKGVGTSLKHFAANNQEIDRASLSVEVDERTLRELYLKSFEIAVKEGHPSSVMTAHNRINGLKCAENEFLLKGILKSEWNYDGLVMTDWGDAKNAALALKCGIDLAMPYKSSSFAEIKKGLENGIISEADIDEAVERILKFIFREEKSIIKYDRDEQHELAVRTAEEGIVLLKNDNNTLPITKEKYKKIVIIGEYAEKPVFFGYGSGRVYPNPKYVDAPLMQLHKILDGEYTVDYVQGYYSSLSSERSIYWFVPNKSNDYGKIIAEADLVIMFIGNQFGIDTEETDRSSAMIDSYYNTYINRVRELNDNIALIIQTGSAVVTHVWKDKCAAILEMWVGGEGCGKAIANILCGITNPSGKLPETFPTRHRTDYDYPGDGYKVCYDEKWAVGYRYYDLHPEQIAFPFGFGLSYTEFEYNGLNITDYGNHLKISFDIRNIGNVSGKESAQIYISDPISYLSQPQKRLVEFCKSKELMPGELEHFEIEVDKTDAFAYYSINLHERFIEPGAYEILIGASSRDIRLKGEYIHKDDVPFYMNPNGWAILG